MPERVYENGNTAEDAVLKIELALKLEASEKS